MNNFVPLVSMPTATILVDDDSFFIDNIKSMLPKDTFPSIVCASKLEKFNNQSLFKISKGTLEGLQPNSFKSLNELFEIDDELPVSTIVIDQSMYPKNGTEILKTIDGNFVQKILISNFFPHEDAIEALNEGIINTYLCKMNSDFITTLTNTIYEAQYRFFCNLSLATPNFLSQDNPLIEKEILTIFKSIQEQYAVRYYKYNKNIRKFSFSCHNKKEKVNLNIISYEELDEILQSQQSESASEEVIQLIRNGKMLPCFHTESIPDGEHWFKYLKPAQTFHGKKRYIYSVYRDNQYESI